jgi:hypothetical protein
MQLAQEQIQKNQGELSIQLQMKVGELQTKDYEMNNVYQ